MTILAIVPARGGSKGVPRKNLRMVAGQSLVARAIRGARDAGCMDHIVVSSDDAEILAASAAEGAETVERPAVLASDSADTVGAVLHAVSEIERRMGRAASHVVLLEPTSPLRPPAKIAAAVNIMKQGAFGSVVSVCPLERKPQNIFVKAEGTLVRYIRDPAETFDRRQDMDHLCRLNSAIYVVGRDTLVTNRTLLAPPIGFVEMTPEESINVDLEIDLQLANLIAGTKSA